MPELPEVQVIVNSLDSLVKNKKISNVLVRTPKMIKEINSNDFCIKLKNQVVKQVTRRSKFIVFQLTDLILLSHLRMEGKYFFFKHNAEPKKNSHLIFCFADGSELHYQDTRMFGTFHLRNYENYLSTPPLSLLAKEMPEIDFKIAYNTLQRKNIPIKTALLDQSLFAGIGNIYADEILFVMKIHPTTRSKNISMNECKQIINISKKIFDDAIKAGGSSVNTYLSVNNVVGSYQNELKVYGRNKQNCFICSTKIDKIQLNGRGTHFCPKCQQIKN